MMEPASLHWLEIIFQTFKQKKFVCYAVSLFGMGKAIAIGTSLMFRDIHSNITIKFPMKCSNIRILRKKLIEHIGVRGD